MPSPNIYPVVLPVPETDRELTGRQKVTALSERARHALRISVEKSGLALSDLPKNEDGVPMPVDGHYWSLTHKIAYVGGVVSETIVGMDIEKIRPCSPPLYGKTATAEEWALFPSNPLSLFFRYWTAKESVLKASGTGVKDLLKCRVVTLEDDTHLTIDYRDEIWLIEHIFFDGHIASVTKNGAHVNWVMAGRRDEITPSGALP